ncbi:uncharacterized protein MELLADRAFT_88994 [Melampsora larici-populina 98AG31]|uniref:GCM domain-containing protein n=1 Tax=Melampsora larici-populina (strain 98AG31 / pathotype 3-4-7) TaxID=747676 RepID=F4R6J9_MELLP|nr:uncharacterized protein MELLADRAFT_88994 [Melampsora larici-populina 98AG31]EGG11894.1 hypothetical protein MELLADRAFT_88994 [Melampsora larici-populina 98AG31]
MRKKQLSDSSSDSSRNSDLQDENDDTHVSDSDAEVEDKHQSDAEVQDEQEYDTYEQDAKESDVYEEDDNYEDEEPEISDDDHESPHKKRIVSNSSTSSKPQKNKINSSNSSTLTKPKKPGKKTFGLPLDRTSFKTFIDENNTLDNQGYPLFPNGNTVFVKQPGQAKIVNWGTFGFAYTSSGGKSKGPADWRTVRYTCLGVIVCESLHCEYLGSPATASAKRSEWMSTTQKCPAARCSGNLRYLKCTNTLCRLDEHESGWGIIRHSGFHQHQWPRRGKPDKLSLEKFGKRVVENPGVGPLQNKVGRAPAGKQEIVTDTNIHGAFGNLHRTGYYRRKLLEAAGVIPVKKLPGAADNFILDMDHWAERGLTVVSVSMKRHNMHLTFQTEWMQQQLLARDENQRVHGGGLLSDVTYKFFKNGYLLSTSMYHEDLRRWIPIQLTWLKGLSEEHYASHFRTLMKQMKRADVTATECDTLVRQVVDFSVAQKNGFIKAYMKVFKENDRAVALSKLQGCHEHFRAQVTRVKRNRAIIHPNDEESFELQASSLLKADRPGGLTFDQKLAKMIKEFPKAKRWLEWWKASDVKSLLFKSRLKQIDDDGLCDNIMPTTTNAQESLHRVYYMISYMRWWPVSKETTRTGVAAFQ